MIKLYRFPGVFGLPSASPFCIKAETYLRMAGLDYEPRDLSDPRRAPHGKLPFIRDGERFVADSTLIIDYLKETYGDPVDEGLSPRDRAAALAFQRLLEEHLYWFGVHLRWIDDRNWPETRRVSFAPLPLHIRLLVPPIARRQARRQLHGHGFGRHGEAARNALALADIAALADWLGDNAFMMGDEPRSIDATAHAFVALLTAPEINNPLRAELDKRPTLARYCERMQERYYAS